MDSRKSQVDQYYQAFSRYFKASSLSRNSGGGFGIGGFLGFGGGDRNIVNEIVEGRVFLSNMPSKTPFSHYANLALEDDSALVVSCVDMAEVAAKSTLLLEPLTGKVRYHVLPMEDVIAEVGHRDQIFDTLALMSSFADRKKPIHIHCMHGVGRSAMMTSLHIAHRYLLSDPIITDCIDSFAGKKLNPESETFIRELYELVSNFVLSKRQCCQFYDETRNKLAREILTEIRRRIQRQQPIVNEHDENYQFLAALTASAEFKRLMHHVCRDSASQIYAYNHFANLLLNNATNWYQELYNIVNGEQLKSVSDTLSSEVKEKNVIRELFSGVKSVIDRIALEFPEAQYSRSVVASHQTKTLTVC